MLYRLPVLLFFSVLLLQLGMTEKVWAALIQLQQSAKVTSPVVTLGDVAKISDKNPELINRLESVTLRPAPAAGKTVRIDFATIRSRLQAHGVNLAKLEFSGQNRVKVSVPEERSPVVVPKKLSRSEAERTESKVAEAVEQYFQNRFPDWGKIRVSAQLESGDVPLLLEAFKNDYEVRGGRPPWDAPQQMQVRFRDEEKKVQEVDFLCRITPLPYIIAAKRSLPRGHILKPEDLSWKQVEDASIGLSQVNAIIGQETKRRVREGQPIGVDAIRAVPLIRNNDIVTVYSRSPGITVKRQLKARSSGALGETVTLVTLDGRQQLLAKVVGYHEAEVIDSPSSNSGRMSSPAPIQFRSGQSTRSSNPGRNRPASFLSGASGPVDVGFRRN